MMNGNNKILTSRQEIMDYLNVSRILYAQFVKMGMPVLYMNGRCYAHTENIDEFFRRITRVSAKGTPEADEPI